jgi:hypothetical protein
MKIAFLNKAAAVRAALPSSPLLRALPDKAQPRVLLRRWGAAAIALIAAAAPALAVAERWFDPGWFFRPLYAIHDNILLPVVGRLWTAWFPWGLLYLIPGIVMAALTAAGFMSGRRPLASLQRRTILAAAREDAGPDLLCSAHRLQCRHGLPGRFMRMVIANAADAAVDAILFAPPDARERGAGHSRDPAQDLEQDGERYLEKDLAHAWRLVAMRGEMTADAKHETRPSFAAAAQIVLLWLLAPPADERTRRRVQAAWQRLWLALLPKAGADGGSDRRPPDLVADWLRHELSAIEAAIREIERRDIAFTPGTDARSPHQGSWLYSWEHYAERLVIATFLAGLAREHAGLAMAVMDAVERVALADLASARDGAFAAAEAVAQAIEVTQARQAASLIGANIDHAAAADLAWWRQYATGANQDEELRPGDLAPALRGLAEAGADPGCDDRAAEAGR